MSRENFLYWKELVGLENTEFPQLISLPEEEIDKASIVSSRLIEIHNAIASNTLVNIRVQPGWGATTLFRYLKHELKEDSLTLLVDFDFERNPLDGELSEAEFIFHTKWKMANGICKIMWETSMPQIYMYDVLRFEDNGTTNWIGHLRKKMNTLPNCENDIEKFYAEFPFFDELPIDGCVNYFLKNFQIRTVFLYLFPRRVDEDALLELVGTIKNIYDGRDIQAAAMREVYIGTPNIFKQMYDVYTRPSFVIPYQRYSAGEMFSMLVSSYNDSNGFVKVSDVLDQEFITKAYSEKATLVRIMDKVAKAIEQSLEGNTADIPYKIIYQVESKYGRDA